MSASVHREDDYDAEISRILKKYTHRKASLYFFLTEKLTWLFLLKEVKPSLQSKNDKTSNSFLITCFRSYNCTLSLKSTVGKFVFQYFIKTNLIGGALWD